MTQRSNAGDSRELSEACARQSMDPVTRCGRRKFLSRIVGVAVLSVAGGPPILAKDDARDPIGTDPESPTRRQDEACRIRHDAADLERQQPISRHEDNGDEALFENKIASYSKNLPHNELGEVDPNAYQQLLLALASGDPTQFESIPLGGSGKLIDPQAAYAFDLEGADSHRLAIAAPPAFSSAWEAGEMVELYWQALTRDVPFIEFPSNPTIRNVILDLSAMSDFRGPKSGRAVTPETLFRGDTPGDLAGPYLSQFLLRDVPCGAITIVQRYRTTAPGDDHMRDYEAWLKSQNGMPPQPANKYDATLRYIRNGRDLGEFARRDFTYQAFLNACLILLSFGPAALDRGNPYLNSATQDGFVMFGASHILDLVARVTSAALRAAWCQKWLVHRRLRPEVFAARVHNRIAGMAAYPIHPEVLTSQGASAVFGKSGSYLLPMAYPEGSPAHPAYPAGHSAIAGACATVLKAFFNESFVIPKLVQASADGLSLLPFAGRPLTLTVGGELNKLAANIGFGRTVAGVHWRSDVTEGMKLGEEVAINLLGCIKATCRKDFTGFNLTKFDGVAVTV